MLKFDFENQFDSFLFTPQVLKEIYFDENSKRYKWKDGNRFVSKSVVSDLIERKIESEKEKLKSYTSNVKNQDIGTYKDLANTLKNIHVLEVAKQKGFENISNSDLGIIGNQLKKQYYAGVGEDGRKYGLKYLIQDAPNLSEAQIKNRLDMFGKSAEVSSSAINQFDKISRGLTISKRILGKNDNHCIECVRYASLGWLPIGELPLPKTKCTCRSNCLCSIIYE